jgi:WhiB family redox-sensing transcriptional regulator
VNPIFQRADWMEHAKCRGMSPEFFHPTRGQAVDHIKAICKDCPVIDPCRKMALEDHTLRGVWGGMSETQRRDYRQRRRNRSNRVSAAFQSLRGTA